MFSVSTRAVSSFAVRHPLTDREGCIAGLSRPWRRATASKGHTAGGWKFRATSLGKHTWEPPGAGAEDSAALKPHALAPHNAGSAQELPATSSSLPAYWDWLAVGRFSCSAHAGRGCPIAPSHSLTRLSLPLHGLSSVPGVQTSDTRPQHVPTAAVASHAPTGRRAGWLGTKQAVMGNFTDDFWRSIAQIGTLR